MPRPICTNLLVVTRAVSGDKEGVSPALIETMRPADDRLAPKARAVLRMQSGRELAVMEDYDELIKAWDDLLSKK